MASYPYLGPEYRTYADGTPNPNYRGGTFRPSGQDVYNQKLAEYLTKQYSTQMDKDLAKGRAMGLSEYGPGALGRLDTGAGSALAERYRTQSELGMAAPEFQALRERNLANINQQAQGGLQQANAIAANSGVRGAAAAGLSRQTQRDAQLARQEAERGATLDDLSYRTGQQDKYGAALQGNQETEKYNLEQQAREKQGVQAYQFGYGSLGAAQQAAAQKYIAGQQNIQAAQAGGGGGGGGGGK